MTQLNHQHKHNKDMPSSSGQVKNHHGKRWQDENVEEAEHAFAEVTLPGRQGRTALLGKSADATGAASDGDDAASMASGSQSAGDAGEGLEPAGRGADAEDELVADWRWALTRCDALHVPGHRSRRYNCATDT
jgi:hypothetical protein